MNQLLHVRTSRLISYVLILALVVPLWTVGLLATPAEAQTPHLTVGVIDFRNESGVQGEVLSRLATDAVALELAKQPVFDILSRAQVAQQMKALGITPPLNKIGLSKLGEALTADAMVEGAIRSVQVKGTGGSRRAAATMVVRMLDQASGEVINGGIQTGYSNPRVGYEGDDDTLITEAIDNASFLVVKTMSEYIIPEATVQNSVGEDQVMLNKGSRDGIKRGMRMIVKRDKEIIGYLQVNDVRPIDSIATVARAMRGVKAEDKATAIFDMPAVSEVHADPNSGSMGAPPAKKSGTKMSKAKNWLIGLAAVAGLALLFKGGTGAEDPGTASVTQTRDNIQLTWNHSKLWGGKNVNQYLLWRNDITTPVAAGANWRGGSDSDKSTTAPTGITYTYVTGKALDEGLTSAVPRMVPNKTYIYNFSAIYNITPVGGTESEYFETERVFAGSITFIDPWLPANNLIYPMDGKDYDFDKKFAWNSRQGANSYIVQVSTAANFPAATTWTTTSIDRNSAGASGQQIDLNRIDQVTALNTWLTSQSTADWRTMHWRVGYANTTDTSYNGKVGCYVFSETQSFLLPPNPPDKP